jgi:hypothetical protein
VSEPARRIAWLISIDGSIGIQRASTFFTSPLLGVLDLGILVASHTGLRPFVGPNAGLPESIHMSELFRVLGSQKLCDLLEFLLTDCLGEAIDRRGPAVGRQHAVDDGRPGYIADQDGKKENRSCGQDGSRRAGFSTTSELLGSKSKSHVRISSGLEEIEG